MIAHFEVFIVTQVSLGMKTFNVLRKADLIAALSSCT